MMSGPSVYYRYYKKITYGVVSAASPSYRVIFLYHFNSNIKQSFIKDYVVLLAYGMSFLLRVSLDSMYSFRLLELPRPRKPAHVALNASPVKSLKKRVQDFWHAHIRNAADFPNNRGGGGGRIWQNLRKSLRS